MNIVDATKAAVKEKCAMARVDFKDRHFAVIPETEYAANYYELLEKGTPIGRRWAPKIEDVTADDWYLISTIRRTGESILILKTGL